MYRHAPVWANSPVPAVRWWVGPTPEAPADEASALRPPANAAEVRHDLVARVRLEIVAGTYDTEERWEAALDGLARHLAGA